VAEEETPKIGQLPKESWTRETLMGKKKKKKKKKKKHVFRKNRGREGGGAERRRGEKKRSVWERSLPDVGKSTEGFAMKKEGSDGPGRRRRPEKGDPGCPVEGGSKKKGAPKKKKTGKGKRSLAENAE